MSLVVHTDTSSIVFSRHTFSCDKYSIATTYKSCIDMHGQKHLHRKYNRRQWVILNGNPKRLKGNVAVQVYT